MNFNQYPNQNVNKQPQNYGQNYPYGQQYPIQAQNYYNQPQQPQNPPQNQGNYFNTFKSQMSQGLNQQITNANQPSNSGVIPMYMGMVNAGKQQVGYQQQPQPDIFQGVKTLFPVSKEERYGKILSAVVDLKLNPNQTVQIKIQVDIDDAKIPPKVFFSSVGEHPLINPKNSEIMWNTIYQWQGSGVGLLELCKNLQAVFSKNPPQSELKDISFSPLLQQAYELSHFNEDRALQQLRESSLAIILPNFSVDQVQQMTEEDLLKELMKSPIYRQLVDQLLQINQINDILAEKINLSDVELRQKTYHLSELDKQFAQNKENVIMLFNRCATLRERFGKTKILSLLEKLRDEIDEESETFLYDNFGSQFKNNDKSSYDQDCLKYLELRKKYHKLTLKSVKFSQNM